MTGGNTEYTTVLYRCPKCGAERRTGTFGVAPKFMTCIKCLVTMEAVPDSAQTETIG